MTFSYDPSTPVGFVRLQIGDTIGGKGPRPDLRNFSDEEISVVLAGADNNVDGAVAMLLRALANEWSVVPDSTVGPRKEAFSQVSDSLSKRSEEADDKAGSAGTSFVTGFKRVDGYTEVES